MLTRLLCCLCILLLSPACIRAAEEQIPDERLLRSARIAADEGDIRGAMLTYFKVLRQGAVKDNRTYARTYLEALGLSSQEVFQLDPAQLKPDDWDRLVTRLNAIRVQRKREMLDLEYAQSLLRLAVAPMISASTEIQTDVAPEMDVRIDIQPRELTRALDMLLQLALNPLGADSAKSAQQALERIGIFGARVETVKKELPEGKLSPDVQRDLIAAVCIERLQTYQSWAEERGGEEETLKRQRMAKRLGTALMKFLQKQQPQSTLLKQPSTTLDYWRDMAAPRRVEEKF